MSDPTPKKSEFREYVETFVIALLLALVVRTFFVQAFKIPTGSMRPTLMEGDRILVNKVLYGIPIPFSKAHLPAIRRPQRGDMVVFHAPDGKNRDFIKRLAAVGDETVEIKDLHLWINGRPVTDPAVFRQLNYYNRGEYGDVGRPVKVPPGHYFFLGDNSVSSQDSRYWGFLPEHMVIGKAFLIYWPPKRIRWLR